MFTDSREGDTDQRTSQMTEKGTLFHQEQKDTHIKRAKASSFMLSNCMNNLNTLPKSLSALQSAETDLDTVYKRYDKNANEYIDFLSRSRDSEAQNELESYWVIMTDVKNKYSMLMDKIQFAKESIETKSVKSHTSQRSDRTRSSASGSRTVGLRAKAESEKIKLKYVEKEVALKKEQFEKSLQLEILEQQKNAAAADVEATYLERHSQGGSEHDGSDILPKEEIGAFERTLNYLDGLGSTSPQDKPLSAEAKLFVPAVSPDYFQKDITASTPIVQNIVHTIPKQTTTAKPTMPVQGPTTLISASHNSAAAETQFTTFLIKKNLLLESFQQQRFDDKPDRYIVWKKQFKVMAADIQCSALEEITLLTNCVKKDSDAYRLIMSTRASCADSPDLCLTNIWNRLDQRFGSAELLESALKTKLSNLPNMIDRKVLYDLHDLLNEIQAVKTLREYSVIFSYLDSSLGIRPIVQKLPKFIQDKWITRVVNYKKQNQVIFPPFSEFLKFIGEISVIRNDPSLLFETPMNQSTRKPSYSKPQNTMYKQKDQHLITANKMEVNSTPVTKSNSNSTHACLIHIGAKHTINECKAFRSKSLENRKTLLRSHNICLRCCDTSDHFANRCRAQIQCDICKASTHCTALHIDFNNNNADINNNSNQRTGNAAPKHGEETPAEVSSRCTEICGIPSFTGKSCAKILPVRIFPEGQSDKAVLAYAMLDDQSNRTLGKTCLFDSLSVESETIEYKMESCSGRSTSSGRIVGGLVVESVSNNLQMKLPPVIECDNIPDNQTEIPTPDVARHYPHLHDIAHQLHEHDASMKIMLLIGRDLSSAHHVLEQKLGPPRSPFAQRSPLGWTIIGDVCLFGQHCPSSAECDQNFIIDNGRPTSLKPCEQIINVRKTFIRSEQPQLTKYNIFETTSHDNKPGLSIEDRKFLDIMDKEFRLDFDGKWVAPLPFGSPHYTMPDNYLLALNRAKSLDASLHRNETKKQHLLEFMQKIIDNHHAEIAPYLPPDRERWYLPLFGVYHPRKPEQIRGVFDASAKFNNVSLNDQLLQGPDLINSLLGILIRFRKEMVGVVADIQQMFHSFLVQEEHRDFLRFLWHKDNVIENPLVTYRMRVHVFGNRPSPSIAMYGLRRIGELATESHGDDVKNFINNDFYVDDGLKSCPSSQDAIDLILKTQEAMKMHGNLRLHKFASNSKVVMNALEPGDLAKGLVDMDFEKDSPTQRSLGLLWDLGSDTFKFSISNETKSATRRGILSVVNSLYDPMGFISPITVQGKIILRKIVSSTFDWDDPLPEHLLTEWNKWSQNLPDLEDLRIPRIIVPNLSNAVNKELFIYCDASELAIAAVCYLHVSYSDGSTSTGFVLGKAKVAPAKCTTIPRLELCSAVLGVEIAQIAVDHLQINIDNIKYFSDSRVVLGYINNEKRRFFVYVANRVARIRSYSEPTQWLYVRSEKNPADIGTRGIHPADLQNSLWLHGPSRIEAPNVSLDKDSDFSLIQPDVDVEIRSNKVDIENVKPNGLGNSVFEKFSDWNRLNFALATVRKFIRRHLNLKRSDGSKNMDNVELLHNTEQLVLREVQQQFYESELNDIRDSKPLNKHSSIVQLDPFIGNDGLLRVGGRLKHIKFDSSFKNPIILPAKHHVTTLIVRKYHEDVKHQGRHFTEGRIRSAGYWVVGCKRLVSSILHKCVTCRKLRKEFQCQKMSNLPVDRIEPEQPPFSSVGVDMFGPWEVLTRKTRGGAANSKRWAALFTCLVTRAVHIEVVEEMSASSFINALLRFQAIRGPVRIFRSDRGTNFVGTVNEMNINVIEVENGPIKNFLQKHGISWIFNSPHSSHMGGVWERMIGVTRRILDAMLLEYGSRSLTHEVLTTFLAEASYIINSRPLVETSTDPNNPFILSPLTLLTQKSNVLQSNIIDFETVDKKDLLRKQWKRVQNLAAIFWKRWKVEYLNTLQNRRKWTSVEKNVSLGDVVLVRDKELSRNSWPLGIVTKVMPSDDGLVRKVELRMIIDGNPKTFLRPISEVVLLVEQ